ncbi:hypothetical protein Tco_1145461 [Tanacetum coccineum]
MMNNLSEDIQCADYDTRPPMLDRADFESWQQRIRLYCMGKDNGNTIIKSIDEGPERDRVVADLTPKENERYKADIHGRFVTTVKLNRGMKTSNYDQLYAYLKQHEAHANDNMMMLEKYNQHAIDPIAFMSNVSPQQYPSQSSATLQF